MYSANQEFHNPFVVLEENGHRYILSDLIDFKNILWDIIMTTPVGQDINRALVIAELTTRGLTSNSGSTANNVAGNITGNPPLTEKTNIYFA
jgi:hypothetical protein